MATHSSFLAWRIPDREALWAAAYSVTKSWVQLKQLSMCSSRFLSRCRHNSVQFSHSVMSDFATPWTVAHQASLSITISQNLLKLMFIKSVMPSNHLILCHPLFLLPSIFPSIRVFSNESVLHIRGPKGIRASASVSVLPMNSQD